MCAAREHEISSEILMVLMQHQRPAKEGTRTSRPCETCIAAHRERVARFVSRGVAVDFALPDADRPDYKKSLAALQRECRERAYGVIQRSRAWGRLIAERFPEAVRLSIHPQPCGSDKLSINLLEASDNWITPWHGTAVDVGGRFVLMKRYQAEASGADLIYLHGRPSHYVARQPHLSSNSSFGLVA